VNGGYGWTNTDKTFETDVRVGIRVGIDSLKQKGGLFGGHAGCNWQHGSVVTGLEFDFDGADIKVTEGAVDTKTNELASARARLGYLVSPNLLAYGTAGAGYGHTNFSLPTLTFSGINQFGWVAGAGLEYKLWEHWIGVGVLALIVAGAGAASAADMAVKVPVAAPAYLSDCPGRISTLRLRQHNRSQRS
jgi:opacity protein-like surface antigen